MLHSNKEYLESTINKMVDILSISKETKDNNIATVSYVLYVSYVLQQQALEKLLSLPNTDSRESFLVKELIKQKVEQLEARNIANAICQLNHDDLINLFALSFKCELPNYEIATYLIDLWQSQVSVGINRMPNELADLSFNIACQFNFDKEDLENDTKDLECLCIGSSADSIAIRAGNAHNAKYEMRGVGIGATIQQILIRLSGGTIEVEHQQTPSFKLSREKQFFNVGFLSDIWGSKSREMGLETPFSNFANSLSEVRYLEEIINRVDGVVVCLMPSSWLNKTSGSDVELKKHLIQSGLVEAIIQLPERIMSNTTLAPNLVVFNTRKKQSRIKFIDASDETFYTDKTRNIRKLVNHSGIVRLYKQSQDSERNAIVDNATVLNNNCILSVTRYVSSHNQKNIDDVLKHYKLVPLDSIADIMRCHMIKPNDEHPDHTIAEIGPMNIDSYFKISNSKPFKNLTYSHADIDKVKKQTLRTDDIVFVIKGSVGKLAIIDKTYQGYVANQSFVIIRLNQAELVDSINDEQEIISPIILFRYLCSDIGRELVSQRFTGTSVPMVKMQDLKELTIPIPTLDEQQKILKNHIELNRLFEKKKEIEQQIADQFHYTWGLSSSENHQ